jgi:hypothetical protein
MTADGVGEAGAFTSTFDHFEFGLQRVLGGSGR